MKTLEPISYSTELKRLPEILSALDSMAIEALAKLQETPAHSSPVDPDHAKIHGLLNSVADLRVALKFAS
jgi:hypothetical protein